MRKRCIVKQLWEWGTPYIQIGGFAILLGTYGYAASAAKDKVDTFDERITANEKAVERISVIEGKLDIAIQLLRGRK